VGGGGQGNHLGGAYGRQLLAAMRSRYAYNALGQEKTGDFWVNGRLFGSQRCPALTYADAQAQERAFRSLELLVVVDVAMTETARLAHYVLPAASQFEKWEATGFTLEFPDNYFHLRRPLLAPLSEALPEPEIYTRLLERMGAIPTRFPLLSRVARAERELFGHLGYLAALAATLAYHPAWAPFAASIVYRTLGPVLPGGAAAAAVLLPLAVRYAAQHRAAVLRAGHAGNRLTLGPALFRDILEGRSGIRLSRHEFADTWSLLRTPDRRVHLSVAEMLDELRRLADEAPPRNDFPFVLMAGERRAYNANQVYRNPAWRKTDADGAMRMHPDDARALDLVAGARAVCQSAQGEIEVVVQPDDTVRRGVVTLPHGYGMRYRGAAPSGPAVNALTSRAHCDPLTKTPFHKYVPVRIRKLEPTPPGGPG
jgi:anaerobic selenocysteine-containing dehydrogenase